MSWYVRHCPEADLRAQMTAIGGGVELAALLPELRLRLRDLPRGAAVDPEGRRYQLFEAIAALLAVASQARPILLVFEDLHWADKPTLLLVRHVVRSARTASVCIMATYRATELGRAHPFSEMLIGLRREAEVTTVTRRTTPSGAAAKPTEL